MKGVVEQCDCQGDPILFMLRFLPDSLVLTLQSHGERREMNTRGWWGGETGGFNLFGPRLAAGPIRLPPLSVCSCEVPSLNCNHRETSEVRDVWGQKERRGQTEISLCVSYPLSIFSVYTPLL